MEEHGILMDDILKSPGKVIVKQYSAPKYRRGESEMIVPIKQLFPTASSLSEPGSSAPRSPPLVRPIQIPSLPPIERTSSRDHPPSPVGPRPQRPRPTSSPVGDSRDTVGSPTSRFHVQDARSRMHSGSPTPVRKLQLSEMLASLPQHSQSLHARYPGYPRTSRPASVLPPVTSGQSARGSSAASSFIHAPAPVPALEPKILPMITAPKVGNAELQKTINQYANMVNEQAQNWNTVQTQHVSGNAATAFADAGTRPQDGHARQRSSRPSDVAHTRQDLLARFEQLKANKENVEQTETGQKSVQGSVPASEGGLGFGSSVPMPNAPLAKEMTNMLVLGGPERKDKKHRGKLF